jgi:hypothetical protein
MEAMVYHNLILQVTYPHFCYILLVTPSKPHTVLERTKQGHEY